MFWNSVEFIIYTCNNALLYSLVIRIINHRMICCYLQYLSMLLQRFYSLILPNPGVQIAYNKSMFIYNG